MPLAAVPEIRPISDLRTDLNAFCDFARECAQPIFMTKNGKPALVVFDCDAYEAQRQRDRYVAKIREAEIEAKYVKETVDLDQLDERMSSIFSHWGK